jgi:epoxyqueuosine reductase
MMEEQQLANNIKQEALRLGFSLAGICAPGEMGSYGQYQAWVEAGLHADMDYLARSPQRERRRDVREIMPECRSVLVLAAPYDRPGTDTVKGAGLTAAYAWGQDYHDVLPERLDAIVAFIEELAGRSVAHRSYTDTGPILERELAQRAGLGWIGKNSMLINPKQGSYFLLAEILLDIELPADNPLSADHCGTCTKCIDACPTDCILPERTLDAERCISYLTIENKAEIPIELRDQIGDWIFGCDICQQVCPWNERFAPESGDALFRTDGDIVAFGLGDHMTLDATEFASRFKGRPQKRAKRRGLLRNVAVAMGNQGDSESASVLGQAILNDEDALVRAHSAWALGQIAGDEARHFLEAAKRTEKNGTVLTEIELALKEFI